MLVLSMFFACYVCYFHSGSGDTFKRSRIDFVALPLKWNNRQISVKIYGDEYFINKFGHKPAAVVVREGATRKSNLVNKGTPGIGVTCLYSSSVASNLHKMYEQQVFSEQAAAITRTITTVRVAELQYT